MGVGFFASAFGAFAAAFSTERLISQLGLGTGRTVLILLLGGTIGAVGFFVGVHLADAWGRRATSIMALSMALGGGLVAYSVEMVPAVVAGIVVSSFGIFALVPSAGSHRAELFPTTLRSSATTAAANFNLAGSAAGLMAGIFTIDAFGLTTTVMLLGVGVVVAILLTTLLPETRGQDLTAISVDRR
jgi:MFS family permease